MKRRVTVWVWLESALNVVTVLGLVTSLYWLYIFWTGPMTIRIEDTGIFIKDVPFSYVVSSLFSMSLGGAYRSIKALIHYNAIV